MIDLAGKTILITGSARRIGRAMAIAVAHAGADVIIHHAHSPTDAEKVRLEIASLGRRVWIVEADLEDPHQAQDLIPRCLQLSPLFAVVNNAAIFEALDLPHTDIGSWNRHLAINLTAPFLVSKAFAAGSVEDGRIVNILDWRAFRPGLDHFAYTISKAALATLTKSLALSLAPTIAVNGLALGAILPPSNQSKSDSIIKSIPAKRWAAINEVEDALLFLLTATYITGEIIYLDGGRHLV
jgi:NAD(P)-dependent dehydrogenase (short-subunit alcohol dehydrogenase family)